MQVKPLLYMTYNITQAAVPFVADCLTNTQLRIAPNVVCYAAADVKVDRFSQQESQLPAERWHHTVADCMC